MSRPVGRPALSAHDRLVVITASVAHAQREWLRIKGSGSISKGLRLALVAAGAPNIPPRSAFERARLEAELAEKVALFAGNPSIPDDVPTDDTGVPLSDWD